MKVSFKVLDFPVEGVDTSVLKSSYEDARVWIEDNVVSGDVDSKTVVEDFAKAGVIVQLKELKED